MKISKKPVKKVPLSTNGELSIYFIGCGSAFAKTLKQNNILVAKGDRNILIDCGGTCSQSLYEVGVSLPEIDTYLITHSHADHIGGLEEVHMMGRYVLNKKPTMIINKAYEKILWEQSLRGGSEMSEKKPLGFKDLWTIIRPEKLKKMPRETYEVTVDNINIKMPRTAHFPDSAKSWRESAWSCGVIFDDKIFFTSDTRFDPSLIKDYDNIFDFDVMTDNVMLESVVSIVKDIKESHDGIGVVGQRDADWVDALDHDDQISPRNFVIPIMYSERVIIAILYSVQIDEDSGLWNCARVEYLDSNFPDIFLFNVIPLGIHDSKDIN